MFFTLNIFTIYFLILLICVSCFSHAISRNTILCHFEKNDDISKLHLLISDKIELVPWINSVEQMGQEVLCK